MNTFIALCFRLLLIFFRWFHLTALSIASAHIFHIINIIIIAHTSDGEINTHFLLTKHSALFLLHNFSVKIFLSKLEN